MRDYERLINECQTGIEQLTSELPVEMQAPLKRPHAFDDIEHMQKTFSLDKFQKAYNPHRTQMQVRAKLYVISQLVQDISAVRDSIGRVGGVETYDKMRAQIEAILNAPPQGD